jgi:hypothetical protein
MLPNPNYRYPYLDDPFEAAEDQQRRWKWLQEAKVVHGSFIPSGTSKSLSRPSQQVLPEILRSLHAVFVVDWPDANFDVMATEDDLVVVRFELDTVDSERGLLAYMNVLSSSDNATTAKYDLKRVVEDWGRRAEAAEPGGTGAVVFYTWRPPWVRHEAVQPFFTLHPARREVTRPAASGWKDDASRQSSRRSHADSQIRHIQLSR